MIKPKQIPDEKQRDLMKKAEQALDKHLYDKYKGVKLYVGITSELAALQSEHRFVLFDMYRAAGWDVSFDTDTVDGLPSGPYFDEIKA